VNDYEPPQYLQPFALELARWYLSVCLEPAEALRLMLRWEGRRVAFWAVKKLLVATAVEMLPAEETRRAKERLSKGGKLGGRNRVAPTGARLSDEGKAAAKVARIVAAPVERLDFTSLGSSSPGDVG